VHPGLGAAQPPDLLVDVHGQADGAGAAVGGPAGDRLADPPGGVGGELEALAPVELLHRAQQAQVALLDQVAERQPGGREAAGDGDDQAQVGLDHLAPGPLTTLGGGLQLGAGRVVVGAVGELELGVQAGLVGLGQLDLVLLGEQRVPTDLVKVQTERIRRLEVEQLVLVLHRTPCDSTRRGTYVSLSFANNHVRKTYSRLPVGSRKKLPPR